MPRKKKIEDAYEGLAQNIEGSAQQAAQATREAYLGYEDATNKAQDALAQQNANIRADVVNAQNRYDQGVQSIIAEGEARLKRQQEIANAEYLASQKAAQASGLTHLASSIANLIGVGGFNASNQTYQNPSIDWMRKSDQDRQIARQRMDNLRERQRQVQMRQLEMQMNNAGQLANMDTANAQQEYQHRMGQANARQNTDLSAANIAYQAARDAGQARVQGVTAQNQADMQQSSLGLQQQRIDAENRRYEAQMRAQGLNPDGSINEQYVRDIQKYNGGKGVKDDDYLSFRVNEFENMPAMDWEGSASWLVNTLLSSIDTITDIPENQKGQLRSILQDPNKKAREKGELLQRFIGTSAQLRNLIQRKEMEAPAGSAETGQGGNTSPSGGYTDSTSFMDHVRGMKK